MDPWEENQEGIVSFIQRDLGLTEFSREEILTIKVAYDLSPEQLATLVFLSLERVVAKSVCEYIAMYSEPSIHSFLEGFGLPFAPLGPSALCRQLHFKSSFCGDL